MGDTGISYLDKTWSVVVGCSGDGCTARCWSRTLHDQRHRAYAEGKKVPPQYAKPFCEVQCIESRLDEPLHWRKPQVVGVSFGGDLFDRQVTDEYIYMVFAVMALCPEHTFVMLTKQAIRMAQLLTEPMTRKFIAGAVWRMIDVPGRMPDRIRAIGYSILAKECERPGVGVYTVPVEHLAHVCAGVSITNQPDADKRLPHLVALALAGWHTWVSYEPAIGYVDFLRVNLRRLDRDREAWDDVLNGVSYVCDSSAEVDVGAAAVGGVVLGCESGSGARWPDPEEWGRMVRGTRDQCRAAGVPFTLKQAPLWGTKGRVVTDHMLDGEVLWDLPWAGEEPK